VATETSEVKVMSESLAKPRAMIDLDEFERRLRRPSAAPRTDGDPLAELARLVGDQQDPYDAVFKEPIPPRIAAEPAPTSHASEQWMFPRPAAAGQPANQRPHSHPLSGSFAAIEAGLRGSIHPDATDFPAAQRRANVAVGRSEGFQDIGDDLGAELGQDLTHEGGWDQDRDAYADRAATAAAQPRSRRPLYLTAAVIAVGIAGIGASFALKGSAGGLSGDIAIIKAADGPTKVQADNSASDTPNQTASILDKGAQTAPVGLVNRTEQPVDLSQEGLPQTADHPARIVTIGNAQLAAGAANVPVPPPPGQVSPSVGAMPAGVADLIEPRKVRTISVRPDGTPLGNDVTAQSGSDAPAVPPSRPVAAAASAKASTPKASARVVTTPKPPASQDAGKIAAQDPVKVAAADPVGTETEAAEAAKGGGFAVQLAAPATEAEARQSAARLGKQFGTALAGHRLTFHRASVGDKSVYRVRVSGLARDDATALCQKVQASGGSCFVAKN
jgi:hypothetical protein